MSVLSWNCRGLGNPRAVQAPKELITSKKPDIVFLSEMLVRSSRVDFLRTETN